MAPPRLTIAPCLSRPAQFTGWSDRTAQANQPSSATWTGVYYPDSGEVLVGGAPVFENPSVKAHIACIPDDLSCHAGSTIRELRQFYKGLYPNFSDARFDALRDIFPLDVKQPLRRFSKGMQKQAASGLPSPRSRTI